MSTTSSGLGFARRIWVAIFALVTIIFMAYVIREHQTALTATHLLHPWLLLLAAFIHCIFWLVATIFWRYVVCVTTQSKLSMSESFRQLALVAVGKYIPGKVWGFLSRGTALKESKATTRGVFAATFVEQWAMIMSAGLVSGLLMLLVRPNGILTALGLVAIITALFGNQFFRIGILVFQRVLAIVSAPSEPGPSMRLRYRQYLMLLFIHSLMWILIGSVLASICFAFSFRPFSLELYGVLLLANTVGIVMGFVALFAPGGLGVREAVTTAVLLPYLPLEEAAILSIAFRMWTTSIDIFLAAALVWQTARAAQRPRV